ncbi:hypothetical protein GCM10010347_31880 [Streptomyces cirratus]|uniref:Integral membrane protein n=1 Tax=Streptomyces cirratus TaxID=68187 RepID=A0ABQ3EZY6_9ACTN|nr:hypothetical protein [Streptomyces cirratus]GHB59537.1 hypothetical protein GCM10010347_31880 [Streptomyces cirratus]
MERRFTHAATGAHGAAAASPGPFAHDVHWTGERRSAIGVAFLLFTALFGMDAGFGSLDLTRGALWSGLAGLAFVILYPSRVSVRPGLLSACGLLMTDTVRTDRLVSVRWSDGVAQRMILRDTDGSQVEIDPTVLVRNPAMWHLLDTDTRASIQRGTLLSSVTVLRQLAQRIDRETAQTVFKVSGLE